MALSLPIEDSATGVVATYWRLAQTNLDSLNMTGRLVLAGYVSDAVRRRPESVPVANRSFDLSRADMIGLATAAPVAGTQTVYDVIAAAAYAFIRADRRTDPAAPGQTIAPEFATATDV